MAWYSILPPELIYVESWVVRCFLFLGLLTIVPWIALLVFDMALYIWRIVTYEVPVVGGRARGMQRPRAPSLNEIPERFGLTAEERDRDWNGGMGISVRDGGGEERVEGVKRRSGLGSER
ncbi:hypothetical protein BJX61DRAFT_532227 [Aspergillus egyptiacus]|nr:hypothetical protein BJX61DRAFT_532227 [Aspergillus egyptiacus]